MATKIRPSTVRKRKIAAKTKSGGLQATAPIDVGSIRKSLGVTRDIFARLTGFSVRTIADWEGGNSPTGAKAQRIRETERLQLALTRVMKADFVDQWLRTPNDAFGGLKPLEVIERGEVDRIWRMIYELESGIPT